MASGPKIFYEFGPFRVDPEKQVLLRENQPVAITPKTFETLLILVRHSREVVSKDELMSELWPDAFVEEANLSQNIFMLRKALGDTPDDRRYIVTVPGKGYRFVAEVREVTQETGDVVIASRSRSQMVIEQTDSAPGETLPALPAKEQRRSNWKYMVAIGAVVGLLALGMVFFLHRRQPVVLGEKDSVLIADFTNTTGDPVFDGTLRQGLAVQLEQSPFLSLVSDERIQRTLGLMGQPPDAQLTPKLAKEVCERTATAAVVDGSIASLGSQYVLGLRAIDCGTGSILADEQGQAARKEDVLKLLSQMASKLRSRFGESLTTVEKHDTPLEDATTSSLEALKAYSTARRVKFWPAGYASAVPLLKHAIEIDPNFAMAYAYLGRTYGDIGEFALSAENTSKAYQLRNHTSERERFFIDVTYYRQVTGNLEKGQQTLESWAETYPHDRDAHGLLSGFASQGSGKYQEAIEEGQKAISLDPDFVPGYGNIASAYIYLDRPGKRRKSFSKLPNANWKFLTTSSSAITSRSSRVTRWAWNGRRPWARHIPGRKTGCCTPSPSPWRVPGSSNRPAGCRAGPWIWPSRRDSGKGRLSLKPEQPCGKRSSGTSPLRGGKRAKHLSFPRAVTWNMEPLSPWLLRKIFPARKLWQKILRTASRKTPPCSSATYQHFVLCSH